VRIVTGRFGGRVIQAPKTTATRPMTDKVRAALFDRLGSVEDLTVLDAYAGSGAIGFEALSRGARRVVAVEAAARAIAAIKANQTILRADWGHELVAATVESWLARPQTAELEFDLIIADPPYAQLKQEVLERLVLHLRPAGLLVVSRAAKRTLGVIEGAAVRQSRDYGDTAIDILQRS
jgi:16S rRNA (guanine966-N2)-methyltransferase